MEIFPCLLATDHLVFRPDVGYEVLFDDLQVVLSRVKTQHRDLVRPVLDSCPLRFRQPLKMLCYVFLSHPLSRNVSSFLQHFPEPPQQLFRVFVGDVLRFSIVYVGQRDRDRDELALENQIACGLILCSGVLIRLKV